MIRKLTKDRRGAAAWATVAALPVLVGFVGLGAEAGSWMVIRQTAQGSADAASYAAGLVVACQASLQCQDTKTPEYRGKQSAAQNGFCNSGDTSYPGSKCATTLPPGTSQTVQITQNGSSATATVSQNQPTYLVSVLGIGPLTIGATATAQVGTYGNPCLLALMGPVNSQSSLNAATCGVASNSTASNALTISNANNIGFMAAVGGCQGCSGRTLTSAQPTVNPLAQLDTDSTGLSLPNCPSGTLTAYSSANRCTNANVTLNDNRNHALASGIYFISGNLRTTGTTSITGTGVTFILLPQATISGSITTTAPTQAPSSSSLPSALQGDASLLRYMGLYSASAVAVQLGSGVNIKGNIYAPSATVTAQGDLTSSGCSQIIAGSVTLNGDTTVANSNCPVAQVPTTPFVRLVQ